MSEYYDRYHRWEPLAEFHFLVNSDDESEEEYDDEKYFYCLCSRTFIRDAVKTYYVEKEEGSESDVEVLRESQAQEWEDQSHVHFSLDTSYKVKCEKDEGASCYCSASHTDNYCSTDEHDPAQMHGTASHPLQPSDSGADLTYQDCHSDYTTNDKLEKMDQDFPAQTLTDFDENYLSEDTWEKFWAINGERLIWASWIKKYSDYINPAYLGENNELVLDENLPKQHSADEIYNTDNIDDGHKQEDDSSMRERKFSYDSKVNPYKKSHKTQIITDKSEVANKDDTWLPLARKRSCSEHDRILSPRTIAGTDSMTNVTKITLSSYDVTSSHVTSESTPTDDYSMSSSTSDDQSNDQTRIANIDDNLDQAPSEELDTEQYWQFLWKKHFGEQYALHYANYIESHNERESQTNLPAINVVPIPEVTDKVVEKTLEIECENSEGNSQEMPTVIEVQTKVDNIKLDDKPAKTRKRGKKSSNRVIGSVGVLLQNLLKEEQKKSEMNESGELVDAGDTNTEKTEPEPVNMTETTNTNTMSTAQQPVNNFRSYDYDEGDDEPPEHRTVSLKRSHEIDDEEVSAEKVRASFDMMGFCLDTALMPKGQLIYSKHPSKLRPPRHKKSGMNKKRSKKIYFDDDGNAYPAPDSQDEREMRTDYDYNEAISECEQTNKDSPYLEATEPNFNDVVFEEPKNVANKELKQSEKVLVKEKVDEQSEVIECEMSAEVIAPEDEIIQPADLELPDCTDNKILPADVDLPDSTDVDTEESDETKNDIPIKAIIKSVDISIEESQETKEDTTRGNLLMPMFVSVEVSEENVPEKVSRPKPTVTRKKIQKKTKDVPVKSKGTVARVENPKHVTGEVETGIEIDACELQEKSDSEQRVSDSAIEENMIEARKPRPKGNNRWGDIGEDMPPEVLDDRRMIKYWKKRHSLFHRFDEGIKLDRESWFSVTPESVARHIATKFAYDVVLDAFCGAGGNTIQFARTCEKVIAVDIDPVKIEMARHNARVYGVEDRIEFIVGDFFKLAPQLEADMVFLSPPWGGPKYSEVCEYDLETMLEPRPASELMAVAREISPYIAIYVPRNTKTDQLLNLAKIKGGSVEVEQSYLGKRFVAITAYYY